MSAVLVTFDIVMLAVTPEIAFTLTVLVLVVGALTFLHVGPDLVLLGGLTLLIVGGVVEPDAALGGFANQGLITVAVLYVVAEGMRQTGGLTIVGQRLLGRPRSLRWAQGRIMLATALLSAVMNNTPVVAMAMPIINDWARKVRYSVSHLLLPLSYATILGGLCTLVGTSTTIVVNGLLIQEQRKALEVQAGQSATNPITDSSPADTFHRAPAFAASDLDADNLGLGMFELAAVGGPCALVGLLYLLICSRWVLPERKPAMERLDDPREYTVEMIVEPGSPLVNQSIEQAGLRHLPGVYLMEIDREEHILPAVSSNEILRANDRLVFVGVVGSVVDLQRIPGLKPATDQMFKIQGPRSDRSLVEAVVSNSCPFLGLTIREAQFRRHYNAAVIAVARNGERVRGKIGDIQLRAGDTLLVEAPPGFLRFQRNSRDFFLVSRVEDSTPPRHERAWVARLILVLMVLAVATQTLEMLSAAMLAAGLMILTRCCKGTEARASVDWGVLLAMAAGLGIGAGLKSSGTDQFLAGGLISAAGSHPMAVLAMVYTLTMVFTNIITAKAAAVLFFPIAMAAAGNLGVSPLPFAIAVMISAAASFATPVGYQTNLMVFGPGGYTQQDYLRLGGPLSILIGIVTVFLAPQIWPF